MQGLHGYAFIPIISFAKLTYFVSHESLVLLFRSKLRLNTNALNVVFITLYCCQSYCFVNRNNQKRNWLFFNFNFFQLLSGKQTNRQTDRQMNCRYKAISQLKRKLVKNRKYCGKRLTKWLFVQCV